MAAHHSAPLTTPGHRATPLLAIDRLSIRLSDSTLDRPAAESPLLLSEVTLEVRRNQTIALVGESGSGKSLTALSILRLLEQSTQMQLTGSISFDGRELLEAPIEEVRHIRGNRIAMIFQEPMTSLNPVFSIGDQIGESLRIHRHFDRNEIRAESIRILARTGIIDPETKLSCYPHQLSGGQRQRVMIAMALACSPDLLIADEPTTALDVSVQARILELIDDIKQEYLMSVLLISHDLALVKSMADYIYIMKDGTVLEKGDTEQIFSDPAHHYTRQLIDAIPRRGIRKRQDTGSLVEVSDLRCSFDNVFSFRNLLFAKKTENLILDHVSFSVRQGTTCGIIGESGSGKTSLALALLKLIPSSGTITIAGTNINDLTHRQLRAFRKKIQIVFQDPFSSLSPRMSVGDIIMEGLRIHHADLSRPQRTERVSEALGDVGLEDDIVSRYPHEFSGGQRQRIAIARALVLRPQLLVLDEPTSALDMTIQTQIIDLLNELQNRFGLTYLFISHDLKVIRAVCDDLIVMKDGNIVESGDAEAMFNTPRNEYTQELFSASLYN